MITESVNNNGDLPKIKDESDNIRVGLKDKISSKRPTNKELAYMNILRKNWLKKKKNKIKEYDHKGKLL